MMWTEDAISVCGSLSRMLYLLLICLPKGISIASLYPRISKKESRILRTGEIPLPLWKLQVAIFRSTSRTTPSYSVRLVYFLLVGEALTSNKTSRSAVGTCR